MAKPGYQTGWRILAVALAVFSIGVPIIKLWQAVLLMLFVLAVFNAKFIGLHRFKRASFVLIGFALLVGINYLLPQPAILESSNVYLPLNNSVPEAKGVVPQSVVNFLKSTFNQYYPINYRDKSPYSSPWQELLGQSNRGAAFSAEALHTLPQVTRKVQAIHFTNYKGLRAGFVNENSNELGLYNFYYEENKDYLTRENLPFFVKYQLPVELASSQLCWQGNVFVSGMQQYHHSYSCVSLTQQNLPAELVGVSFPQHAPLKMVLELSSYWQVIAAIKVGLILASLSVLLLLFDTSLRQFGSSALFLCVVLLAINGFHHYLNNFADTPVIIGGNDGLIYQGYGRAILYHLVHGEYFLALRGGVDIFYYMPGMRYVCALQSFLFGDTILGFLVLEVMLVFAFKQLCSLLFGRNYAWVLIGFFLLASLKTFTKYGLNYSAEIAGYCMLAVGLVNILQGLKEKHLLKLAMAAFLFAFAVMVRPNFLIGVMMCLLFSAWVLRKQTTFWQLLLSLSPFGLISVVALHNLYFGHQFVPFTSSAFIPHNLILSPSDYWQALLGLLQGVVNPHAQAVFHHLFHDWLNNGLFLLPLVLVMLETLKRQPPTRRALLLFILGLQVPSLFWATGGRYTSFAWVLSYFVALEVIFNWIGRAKKNRLPFGSNFSLRRKMDV